MTPSERLARAIDRYTHVITQAVADIHQEATGVPMNDGQRVNIQRWASGFVRGYVEAVKAATSGE